MTSVPGHLPPPRNKKKGPWCSELFKPELLLLTHGWGWGGGGEGPLTWLLVYCWGGLGPLLHPCLCCCNQSPADSQPLGLKYVPSGRCRSYYLAQRWTYPSLTGQERCPPLSTAVPRCPRRACPAWPHPLLPHYPQICLVAVPAAKPRQLK